MISQKQRDRISSYLKKPNKFTFEFQGHGVCNKKKNEVFLSVT